MSNLKLACSPITGDIFVGKVLKDGITWGAGKQDVTNDAIVAVMHHILIEGKPVELHRRDGKKYIISVEEK